MYFEATALFVEATAAKKPSLIVALWSGGRSSNIFNPAVGLESPVTTVVDLFVVAAEDDEDDPMEAAVAAVVVVVPAKLLSLTLLLSCWGQLLLRFCRLHAALALIASMMDSLKWYDDLAPPNNQMSNCRLSTDFFMMSSNLWKSLS